MAVTVFIPTALRQFAGGRAEVSVEAATVGEALERVMGEHAELRRHLYGEQGALRNFVNVYVNDEDIRHAQRLETPVKDGDTVSIIPAIAGGAVTEEAASASGAEAGALPTLSNDEIARYSRHLIMPEVGVEGQRRIKAARVLMIGDGRTGRADGNVSRGGGRRHARRR